MEQSRTTETNGGASRSTFENARWTGALAVVATSAGLLAWLWPIGLGGAMPVGGDVTQFFLGLMSVLSESIAAHRVPVWNDLWGYGFPGIGESQMGAFYPPHVVLYGALSVERAYVASLVLHTLWGGLGAYWAGRVFGLSRVGSAFAAFVFSASGFFVIHMPHPWGYTTGCWLPWAWSAAWRLLDQGPSLGASSTPARRLLVLTLILVLQVLPGHFQIAFMTQFGIAVMAVWACLDRLGGWSLGDAVRRGGLAIVGLAVVFPLSAVQLWPTARLARLAASQRDYEYLSGFATTPFHLVGLVAPNLFHGSPLWRPLVWDPFHTSPEECLVYVGLAPLFLGLLAVARESRRDRGVRCLAVLAAVGLVLSLGPYVPGFRLLIEVPGFSFFRAPARWTLPVTLALAILAGKGLDAWSGWERPGRRLGLLAVGAAVWVIAVLGLLELALWSSSTSGSPAVSGLFSRAFQLRPWDDGQTFKSVANLARSFERTRFEVYQSELLETSLLLGLVVAVAMLARIAPVRRFAPILLIAVTAADLWLLGRHRLVDVGPLRPLTEQSTVLARLAKEPRGTRAADSMRNLPMAVGLAPIQAYRTLDLPALTPAPDAGVGAPPSLAALTRVPLDAEPQREIAFRAMRAAGVGLRVLDPTEARGRGKPVLPVGVEVESISDPVLARWLLGTDWNPGHRAEADEFLIVKSSEPVARAWFIPLKVAPNADLFNLASWDPRPVLDLIDRARPLPTVVRSPVDWDVLVDVDESGWVLISQLDDPQWKARIGSADGGRDEPANIASAFRVQQQGGAWQRVFISKSRTGAVLRLSYDARDLRIGLGISALSCVLWVAAISWFHLASRRRSEV